MLRVKGVMVIVEVMGKVRVDKPSGGQSLSFQSFRTHLASFVSVWCLAYWSADRGVSSSESSLLQTVGRWYPMSQFSSGILVLVSIDSWILHGQ